MGSGKTSRLLAILFALTGSTLAGLTLDDMINLNSDRMVVRVGIEKDGKYHKVERSKRRGYSSSLKFLGEPLTLAIDENIYIEGRKISEIFFGAPKEKMLKLDALLGLSDYNLALQEITTAPIDKKLEEFKKHKEDMLRALEYEEKTKKLEEEIKNINSRLDEINSALSSELNSKAWAEEVIKRASESIKIKGEIESKRELIKSYKGQLDSIPKYSENLEEELNELESRYKAMQRRKTYLEGSFQIFDLESIDKITNCPLCYSPLSKEKVSEFKQYYNEYKELILKSRDLEEALSIKRKEVEQARKDKERAKWLYSQILSLEAEISSRSFDVINEEDINRAKQVMDRFDRLKKENEELKFKKRTLEEQIRDYTSLKEKFSVYKTYNLDKKLEELEALRDKIVRIKKALEEALREIREEELLKLRDSFRRAFRKIYTYEKFKDADFDLINYKGREVLTLKAKVNESWIRADQMSTGETVALSFALLFSINQIESPSILLLDEPEEGLDDEGIRGLAKVLKDLSNNTQILIATRNNLLAELLKG